MDDLFIVPSTFPVTAHTDFVGPGSIFVAIEGYAENGINYIPQAIEKGATTIVVHKDLDEHSLLINRQGISIIKVNDTRLALAQLSAQYAGNSAKKLRIIGITGTKGKTTTSFVLEHILRNAGYKTALISSAYNKILDHIFKATLTTPQPDYLHQFLKLCVDQGIEYVVMEIAAQALTLHRVAGIPLCGIIFTNFSHEHLEFYPTLDDYFSAKQIIFGMAQQNAPIIINGDDERGKQIFLNNPHYISYGCENNTYYYKGICNTEISHFIDMHITNKDQANEHFFCNALFGKYNGYNILAACSMAFELGLNAQQIQHSLPTFPGVPGRLQEHKLSNGARAFIDYAHNPESFRVLLSTLRLLTDHLIVVFGAGGGRDKSKRPLMGAIAAEYADHIVITTDNPRLENPAVIAENIISGIADDARYKIIVELDRKKAIERAYSLSSCNSIIALLGKGPDEYQIIGTTKYFFSEKQIVEQL